MNLFSRIFISFIFFICLFVIFIPQSSFAASDIDELDRIVDGYIKGHDQELTGLSTVIVQDGETATHMYGYTSVDQNLKVDEETVFEWGSSAKLLIWISMMQLVEDDMLDLQTDIREYVPKDFTIPNQFNEPITMSHLMNHTAGFDESFTDLMVLNPADVRSLRETLERTDVKQTFVPGEVVAYSNYGAALAAYVVEEVSGLDFRTYVQENIFTPLDMTETAIDPQQHDNEWVKKQRKKIQGYTTDGELIFPNNYKIPLYPAGSAVGTIRDFTKVLQALLEEDGSPLFNDEETIEKLFQPTAYYPETDIPRIAHGFFALPAKTDVYGHGGNTVAFSSSIYLDRNSKTGVIVMTNQANEDTFALGIQELIFGRAELNRTEELEDASLWEGTYQPARSPYHGFSKIYGLLNRTTVKTKHTYNLTINGFQYDQQQPGVYVTKDDYSSYSLDTYATHPTYEKVLSSAYGDLIFIPQTKHVFELSLLIIGAIASLLSVIYILLQLILKIVSFKKRKYDKHTILQHILNVLVTANIWWMIYSVLDMTTYESLRLSFIVNIGYIVATLGLSSYRIITKKRSALFSKKQTIFSWITIVASIVLSINIVYWEFYL